MKKRNSKIAAIAILLVGCIAMGGIMAYFTDADTKSNEFTIGKVSIDLQELNWNATGIVEDIVPNQVIAKDPKIVNDGINDAFVFLKVTVPYKNISTVAFDGTINAAADTDLFSYKVNDGWVELVDSRSTTAPNADGIGTHTYVYAYGTTTAMTTLAADAETATLFDEVLFVNAREDEGLETKEVDIVVDAYAIQAENLGETRDLEKPASVWTIVCNQNPTTEVGAENIGTDVKNN